MKLRASYGTLGNDQILIMVMFLSGEATYFFDGTLVGTANGQIPNQI
jgi:hypothetical protein